MESPYGNRLPPLAAILASARFAKVSVVVTGAPTSTESGEGSRAGDLAREVSSLQAALLGKLHEELAGDDAGFAAAAQKLAEEFGSVTATAIDPLWGRREVEVEVEAGAEHGDERHPSLFRPGQMRRRLEQLIETNRRYGHPFALVVFDVEGPGARSGDGDRETALVVVGAALSDSTRLLDETFRLEEDALCVLAPNQNTVGGLQMAERLLGRLGDLEQAGGLRIGVSAGVVACPEHGDDAEQLLQRADEAMWRAQAAGQPVGVGALQDR
jgi:diguanylate cyclase (GGDEF)-like protein